MSPSVLSDQRRLIEDLANANKVREREYKELRLALEGTHLNQEPPNAASETSSVFGNNIGLLPRTMSANAEHLGTRKRRRKDLTGSSAIELIPDTGPTLSFLQDELTRLYSKLLTEGRHFIVLELKQGDGTKRTSQRDTLKKCR